MSSRADCHCTAGYFRSNRRAPITCSNPEHDDYIDVTLDNTNAVQSGSAIHAATKLVWLSRAG